VADPEGPRTVATPIVGAAAALKLPELAGSQGNGVRGQALVGAICAAFTAYLSVRFRSASSRRTV
jgi:undecaprenyl-diphosphatase